MTFELFLAKRYLVARRHGFFAIATTLIAIGGTALGVAALIITLAVMDGFRTDIQKKLLGTQPHLVVLPRLTQIALKDSEALERRIRENPEVQATSSFVLGQALLRTQQGSLGVQFRGINPAQESRVTTIGSLLKNGSWEKLIAAATEKRGIVIGEELAHLLHIDTGEDVFLIVPDAFASPLGRIPRLRPFKVVGIFRSGMYETDATLVFLSLPDAQALLGLGRNVTGIGARLRQPDQAAPMAWTLQNRLGSEVQVRSWQDLNRNLFSALKLERTVMFLILTLIILVASFTIVSNLFLLGTEKARDMGILQALGASARNVRRIFLYHGALLGGLGTGSGVLLGVLLSALLAKYRFIKLPPDVYYIDTLPVQLSWPMVVTVALVGLALALVSSWYPASQVSRMDPIEAIRYG